MNKMPPFLLFTIFLISIIQSYCIEQQKSFCGPYKKTCHIPDEYCDGDQCRSCRPTCGRIPEHVPNRCQNYCNGVNNSGFKSETAPNTTFSSTEVTLPSQSENATIVDILPYMLMAIGVLIIVTLLLLYYLCLREKTFRLELCSRFCVKCAVLINFRSNDTCYNMTSKEIHQPTDDSVEEGLFTGVDEQDDKLTIPMRNYQHQKLTECS